MASNFFIMFHTIWVIVLLHLTTLPELKVPRWLKVVAIMLISANVVMLLNHLGVTKWMP